MKIFSDLHLDNSNKAFKRELDGKSHLLIDQGQFLRDLFASAADGELIVCAGDLTDSNVLDSYVFGAVMLFAELVRAHGERGGQTLLLEGNHCITDSKNVYSVVGGLARLQIPSLICAPRAGSFIMNDAGQAVSVTAIPYMDDHDAMLQAMAAPLDPSHDGLTKYMFFHAAVKNALLDNGFPNERGIEMQPEHVEQYDVIVGGDFHRHQHFPVGRKQVYYCGAPFTLRAGQEYPKGHMEGFGTDLRFITCPLDRPILSRDYARLGEAIAIENPERTTLRIKGAPSHAVKAELAAQLVEMGLYESSISIQPSLAASAQAESLVYSPKLSPEQNLLVAIDNHLKTCDPDDPLKQNAEMVKKIIGR